MSENKKYLFIYFIILFEICIYLADDMIMPAMIIITKHFQVSEINTPSALSFFIFGASITPFFLGPLSDKYGRKKFILLSISVFIIASILNSFSVNFEMFLITRFFQGAGAGFVNVIGYAIVQEYFHEKRAIQMTAIMTTISCLVPLFGPFLGRIYIEFFTWQSIHINMAIISILSFLGILIFFNEFVLNFNKNRSHHKDLWKHYLQAFKNKKIIFGSIAYGIAEVPFYSWIAIAPLLLSKENNLSSIEYGLYQLPFFLSYLLGLVILNLKLKFSTTEKIIYFGSYFIVFGLILSFILPFIFGQDYFFILLPFSIYSLGAAIISAPLYREVLNCENIGLGSIAAIKNFILLLIIALFTQSLSFIYSNLNNINLGIYGITFAILYVVSLRLFYREKYSKCNS